MCEDKRFRCSICAVRWTVYDEKCRDSNVYGHISNLSDGGIARCFLCEQGLENLIRVPEKGYLQAASNFVSRLTHERLGLAPAPTWMQYHREPPVPVYGDCNIPGAVEAYAKCLEQWVQEDKRYIKMPLPWEDKMNWVRRMRALEGHTWEGGKTDDEYGLIWQNRYEHRPPHLPPPDAEELERIAELRGPFSDSGIYWKAWRYHVMGRRD